MNTEVFNKLKKIHNSLIFYPQNQLMRELPEQIMTLKYIQENACVLELGGSIGRNSCIINTILKDKKRHVVVEPSKNELNQLILNRDKNNLKFQIENSAISDFPLYVKGWSTYKTNIPGSQQVNTITYNDFFEKYNLIFDTLIIDNEGNFVDMLKRFPNMLQNIKLLIIEHDFNSIDDINYFKNTMKNNGFILKDKFLKNDKYGPGINWSDGVKEDIIFLSVWTK